MALENALLWLMIAAMLLRAAVYGALYFTLPRDARKVKENRAPPKPRDPEAELTGRSSSNLANPCGCILQGVGRLKEQFVPICFDLELLCFGGSANSCNSLTAIDAQQHRQ